jgi:hypothetical protein
LNVVYYESIKREPKIRGIYECRSDERLQTKTKEFTRLPYTGLVLNVMCGVFLCCPNKSYKHTYTRKCYGIALFSPIHWTDMLGECLGLCHNVRDTWSRCQGLENTPRNKVFSDMWEGRDPHIFCVLRDIDNPVPWRYLWVGRCNDHEVLHN